MIGIAIVYLGFCVAFVLLIACTAEEDDDGVGLCMHCEHGPERHHARREGGFIVWSCLATSWAEDSCECDHYRPRIKQFEPQTLPAGYRQ